MLFLIVFAFIAGVVTILSPCILPILPIVLSGSVGGGKRKPLGIVVGFILSFTFFTLALSTIVRATGLSADFLRLFSVVIIGVFGVSLLLPQFQVLMERLFSKLAGFVPTSQNPAAGFWSGVLIGLSLGLIWTPCVGPIIASVITLAATSNVGLLTVFITLAYSLGTAIPMLIIMQGGRALFEKVPWLLPNTEKIQKIFGVIMILTAMGLYFNLDRKFQTFILEKFPQYGAGLTKIEDNQTVKNELGRLTAGDGLKIMGKPSETDFPIAPELIEGGKWFNSQPLKISELKGKVVLVDFWTYTCINCIRTLPYIKSWDEKYRDKGLVIIGVHTPEFEFEKNPDNLARAIKDFGIRYPVIQDNNYETWKAYQNRYWPAKYLIDKNGKIRSSHFGEGAYDETERMIQELLKEAGSDVSNLKVSNPTYQIDTKTPETYLGKARMVDFDSPENVLLGKQASYTSPKNLNLNHWAVAGDWNISLERASPSLGSSLTFEVETKEAFLVMRPKGQVKGRIRVLLDGKAVDLTNSGEDVKEGVVTVDSDRLYKLIKLEKSEKHQLKLEFLDTNLELYAFTFG